jgi:hypothetical protein
MRPSRRITKSCAIIATERATLTAQVWKYILEQVELKADLANYSAKRDDLTAAIAKQAIELDSRLRPAKRCSA